MKRWRKPRRESNAVHSGEAGDCQPPHPAPRRNAPIGMPVAGLREFDALDYSCRVQEDVTTTARQARPPLRR